jgi:hypothetical protein
MLQPTPIAEPLDAYLWEVVQTLQAAVDRGIRNAAEHPDVTQASIQDCEEILDVIMQGDVKEWLGLES